MVETSREAPELYFAGMLCAGSRMPTERETRVLQILGNGGAALGAISSFVLVEMIRGAAWLQLYPSFSILLGVGSLIGILLAFYLSGPALRTLRQGRVLVFAGRPRALAALDANQRVLFKDRPYPNEIVLMADRRTILRMDHRFLPTLERLQSARRIAGERGPDTRRLTPEEKEELRCHIRTFRRPAPAAWLPVLIIAAFPTLFILRSREELIIGSGGVFGGLTLLFTLLFLFKMWSWLRFSQRLKCDLKDDVITGGNLWSGIPWLVDGEPAGWRIARPAVGVVALDVETLKKL